MIPVLLLLLSSVAAQEPAERDKLEELEERVAALAILVEELAAEVGAKKAPRIVTSATADTGEAYEESKPIDSREDQIRPAVGPVWISDPSGDVP